MLTAAFDGSFSSAFRDAQGRQFSGTYGIFHQGRCVYVGVTGDIKQRWGQHRSQLRAGSHSSIVLRNLFQASAETDWSFLLLHEGPHTTSPQMEKALIHLLHPVGNRARPAQPEQLSANVVAQASAIVQSLQEQRLLAL